MFQRYPVSTALMAGFALATAVSAATINKANSTVNLNLGSSWVGGVVPGVGDVARWSATVTGPNTVNLGADTNWLGIKVTNPGGAVTVNSGNTLALGGSGIDLSTATTNLTLNCGLTLLGDQAWNVGNTAALTIGGAVGGANVALSKTGSGTANLNGTNSFSGGLAINSGMVALSNPSALGFASATVALNAQLNLGYLAGTATYTNNLTLTGRGPDFSSHGALRLNGGTVVWSGPITLANGARIGGYAASGNYTFSGGLGGTGDLRLWAGGGSSTHVHTFTISAPCSYTGDTLLDTYAACPMLVLSGGANRLPTNTALTMLAGVWNGQVLSATLKLNGNNQAVAGLTSGLGVFGGGGTNRVVNGSFLAPTLTVNCAFDQFFDGSLGGPGANENNFGLTKIGDGKLSIKGNCTLTRPTMVNAGALNFLGGFNGGAITVANGATLILRGGTNIMTGLTLNTDSAVEVNVGSPSNPNNTVVQINGNLVLGGTIIVQDLGDGAVNDAVTVINYTGTLSNLGLTTDPRSPWNVQVDVATPGQVKLILQSKSPTLEFTTASTTVSNSLQFELQGIARGLSLAPISYEVRTADGQLWDFGATAPTTNWTIRLRHLRLGTNTVRAFTLGAGSVLQQDLRQVVLQLGSNSPVRPRPYPAEIWWGGVATDLAPDYGYAQLVDSDRPWDFVRQFQDGIFLHTFLPTGDTLARIAAAMAPYAGRFAREGTYNTQADLDFGFNNAVQINSEQQALAGAGVHPSFYSFDYNPGMAVWPQVIDPGWCQNWPNWTHAQLVNNNMQCWSDFVAATHTNWPGLKLGMTWSPVWFNWNGYPALISTSDKLTLHPVKDALGNVVNNQYGTNAWFEFDWQEFFDKASATAQAGDGYYGFATDCPWDYFATWANATERASNQAKILGYETWQRANGYFTTTICNYSANNATDTNVWDATYMQNSLAYISAKQKMGGRTQKYLFEAWYPGPYAWVPESNTNSFTGLVKQAIKYLKGISDINGTLEPLNLTVTSGNGSYKEIQLQNNGDIQCLPALVAWPGAVPGVTTRFFTVKGNELTASLQTAEGLCFTNLLQPGAATNLVAVTTGSGLATPINESASLEAFWNPQDPLGIVRDREWLAPTLTPLGSWQSQDIGSVGLAGGVGLSSNVFSVIGSGADIWGTADAFRFVYLAVTGGATITARVSAQLNTDPWARAGVMVRESPASGSRHALMAITPGNGVSFVSRGTTGGSSANVNQTGFTAPCWVRLVRAGTTLTGYYSVNGSNWTQLSSTSLASLPATVNFGVAVCSHNTSLASVVTVDSVAVNSTPWISNIANQTNAWNQPTAPVTFNVGSGTTPASNLVVTAGSSNPALVPNANLTLSGTDSNRFLVINPANDQTGDTTITLAVTDGAYSATNTFSVTFYQTNYASMPWISSVADQTNGWNQATAPIPFNVGSGTTPVSNLVVTAGSSNPALVPNGNLALSGTDSNRFLVITPVTNQTGVTTITLTVSDGPYNATNAFQATFFQTNSNQPVGFSQDSITLLNPSFEWGYNAANVPNHAHGGVYFGWTPSTNAIGINEATNGPYWDNGGAVDGTYVGYIQGLGGYFGALSQTNSGFQVGATYWIQFFANARQTNGITPLAFATNPVVAVIETASTAGTSALVSGLKIPYSDVLGTAGTGNPFTFINVTFTAGAANGVLTIEKRSPTPSGKSALLLDGFSIIRRTTNDIVVANPSFEASGMGQTPPGYMPVVAGWTKAGGGNLAISQQGGAFADNGAVPDGGNVLALQCSLTDPVGVSQALHGLIPGATYWLTLYLNGRAVDPAGGYTNLASVTIDGQTAYRGPVAPSGPANSLDPFLFVSFSFVASAADVTVSIENQAQDSSTLLVDNLRVFTPFSVSISPHGGGLQIDWPVGHLESATNVSGPWRSEPGAVSPWAVTPSASMKFYRSVLP
ncbi:MAG: hypothetical protein WCK27_03090 [Verrucomicrobiota bacterium]